jgi:site-specific recombinase XerC
MIDAYLEHLRVERRLADRTVHRHWHELRRLADFAARIARPLEELDPAAVAAFLSHHPTAEPAVRGYYRFLVLDRRLDVSPLESIR